MKANELMIGDWVRHINGTPYQVTCIKDVHFACGIPHLWEYNNKFEPIALTAEILVKNGWKYEGYANEYSTESQEYFVYDDFDIYINNDGKFQITSMDTKNINLDYVHQLQHALKLCGINKDIEL